MLYAVEKMISIKYSIVNSYYTRINMFSKKLFYLAEIPKSKIARLKIFDIEEEQAFEEMLMLPIMHSLEHISQINYLGSLYLCGVNSIVGSNSGSFLLKITMNVTSPISSILVNSIYPHSCPSMVGWKNEYLFVIGGRGQIQCEYYNLKQPNWHKFPSLPEERFKCSLLLDEFNNSLYLFGGYCSISNKNVKTILKLNILQGSNWEMIIISDQEGSLSRNCSICFQFDSSSPIYILGGKDDDGKPTDYILEYNPREKKSVNVIKQKLMKPSVFDEQNGVDLNKTQFDYIDIDGFITKICKTDFKISILNYDVLLRKGKK